LTGNCEKSFTVYFFECSRAQLSLSYGNTTTNSIQITSTDSDESIDATTKQYCESIKELHKRNFVRVFYTALREQNPHMLTDFSNVLPLCQEQYSEINITQYLRSLKTVVLPPDYGQMIQQKFELMLKSNFDRIGSSHFYIVKNWDSCVSRAARASKAPSDEWEEEEEEDLDEEEDQLRYQLEELQGSKELPANVEGISITIDNFHDKKCAHNVYPFPFLLRFECTVNSVKDSISIPVTSLPTILDSYLTELPTNAMVNFKIIGLTLPPHQRTNNSEIANLPLQLLKQIMKECEKRVKSLLSEEILDGLLQIRPVTKELLDNVKFHMNLLTRSQNRFNFTIPLYFLDIKQARKLFPYELEHSSLVPLRRLDDIFFYVQNNTETEYSLPFWLLISYFASGVSGGTDLVKISFHCSTISPSDRSKLFNDIKEGILNVCKRVNQLLLLKELYETKTCSPLLVPEEHSTNSSHVNVGFEVETGQHLVGKRANFIPGQFSCNKVHCIQFPLHDRVSLSTAITTITTALQLFLVTNRTNLFVYPEENGRIFYLRLYDSPNPEPQTAVKTILLDVYGLDFPTPQITEQLYQLLKSRLASATLLNISTLLARNPQFKLTSEDLEFIRGPTTTPLKYLFYSLPSFIHTKQYFIYLKQNLLQFLRVMLSTSTSTETEHILGSTNQDELAGLKQDSDCIFTYNYLTSSKVTSPVSAAIGRGIAIIQIILFTKEETTVVDKVSDELLLQTCVNNTSSIQPLENSLPENTVNIERAIVVKVWARESLLNISTLVNQMSQSINQCLCEYVVESHFFSKTLSSPNLQQDFVSPVKEIFSKAKTLASPSVQETKITLTLPTWSIDSFLTELYDIIMELNNRLNPVVVFTENSVIPSYTIWNTHNPSKKERDTTSVQSLLMNKESYQFVMVGGKLNWNIEKKKKNEISPQVERKESELWSISDNLLYGHTSLDDSSPLLYRNCVVLVTLQSEGLSVITYNWNYTKIEQLNAFVNKIKSWVQSRQHLLRNILHQKMGLFHHTVTSNSSTTSTSTPPMRSSMATPTTDISKFSLDTIDPLLNNVSPSRKSSYSAENSPSSTPNAPTSPAAKGIPMLERSSSSSNLIKKKPLLGNFDSLLLNSFPSEISQITSFMNIADPLQRHGNQFKLIAYHNSRIQEYRTNTIFNFNLWSKLYQSTTSQSQSKPTLTSLQLLIKNSRIMYSFRLPLYLERHVNRTTNEIESVMTPEITLFTVNDPPNWTKQLLDHYLIDYKAYIEQLGFHVVKFFDLNEQSPPIIKDVSEAPPIETDIRDYYGIKLVRNGLLIIRISFEEPFITCDLYAYHNLRSKLSPSTAATTASTSFKEISKHNKQQIKLFFEEANKTKELLQLKTFIYDFHVKKLHELLNLLLTNDSLDNFDNIINYPNSVFFHFLESLRTYYPQIPPESKHFLYTSVITVELSVPSPPHDIFQYITDNAARYHLFTLKKYGITPSIIIKLPNDNTSSNIDLSNYSALLLLLPDLVEEGETTPTVTQLRSLLYLFYTHPNNVTTEKNLRMEQITSIASKFATYFQNVVNQVALHYKRDLLWRGLNSSTSDVQITREQFQTLKSLLACKLVEQMDNTLAKLVNTSIPWGPVLTHLASSFSKTARTLLVNKEKQLILLNPLNSNVFLHFELTETRNKMQIYSCSRPPQNQKDVQQQTLDENEFVSSVVNQILYYIWKFGLIPNR
jgi:hypothetical protein